MYVGLVAEELKNESLKRMLTGKFRLQDKLSPGTNSGQVSAYLV